MSLFLTASEKAGIQQASAQHPFNTLYWALFNRVERRAAAPGLRDTSATAEWWYFAAEYITDAAMAHAIKASPKTGTWLRDVTLSVARRPLEDWIGPAFRDHECLPQRGNLETAHLSWALAVALDLAPDLFPETERKEIETALREKGITPCLAWLDHHTHLHNWRCVLSTGLAVAAAVLDDPALLERAAQEYELCVNVFQSDGSYGESLQYGNYAASALMLTREALLRRRPQWEPRLPFASIAKKVFWDAQSLLFLKPLSGWGEYPRPRCANFNDSSAIYRASGDLLLHIAARLKESQPVEAGLARWLFDTLYLPALEQPPHDLASFGLINDFGFLSLPLLPQACPALSPAEAKLPLTAGFECGDVFARDAWNGQTVLAVRGGGATSNSPGHLHGDLNSLILAHNRELLLADTGHSCYRNVLHEWEKSSVSHNTCTFTRETVSGQKPFHDDIVQDCGWTHRQFDLITRLPGPPIDRGARRLLLERRDDFSVIVSEAGKLYGDPIREFSRCICLCGAHVVLVIDRILAEEPVRTTWNWLLDNHDGQLQVKNFGRDRLVVRRGHAGMKLFHLSDSELNGPRYSYIHHAYHPLPGQIGEGAPGSGWLMRWKEKKASTFRVMAHAICVDNPGSIAGWHLKSNGDSTVLEGPGKKEIWSLSLQSEPLLISVTESVSQRRYQISAMPSGEWLLQ